MTAGRPSAWLLGPVLTALALFALAHREAVFASLCALLLLGAYGHRFTLPVPTLQRWPQLVGMALAAWGLSWVYYAVVLQAGHDLAYFPRLYYKPVFITTSSTLLALAVVWMWHLPHITSRTNGCILMGAGCLVIASGNFLALPSLYGPCLVLFMSATLPALFVLGGGLPGGPKRLGKLRVSVTLLLLGCTLIIGTGTWAISTALPGLESLLSAALIEMLQGANAPNGLGTGDRLRIERHRRIALQRTIVLTLSGAAPPGYLRTQVMSQYRHGLWRSAPAMTPSASPETLARGARSSHFELPSDDTMRGMRHLPPPLTPPLMLQRTVSLLADLRGVIPLPYTARSIATSAPVRCTWASGTILQCPPPPQLPGYTVTGPAVTTRMSYRLTAAPETSSEVEQAREAPEAVLAALRALAQHVVGPYTHVPLAAARLLQEYFRRHYTYSLQVDLADHGDPVVDFVLHRRPAYCEYYAAGLALMLRALDIPARVVGGFAVHEYNPLAAQWIVRQRDAHAWTEVFDTASNAWVAFDATPLAAGILQPAATEDTLLEQSWVWIMLQARRFLVWTRTAEPQRWIDSLMALGRSLFQRPAGWLALGAGMSLLLGMIQRRWLARLWRWRQGVEPRATHDLDSTVVAVQRLFEQVARALAEHGVPIAAAETLEEYLQRLETLQCGGPGEGVSRTASSLPWYRALAQFAQVYTALRFHCPGVTAPEPDTKPPLPSLALLHRRAAQVLTALQPPRQ